jgi:hypothetical protein
LGQEVFGEDLLSNGQSRSQTVVTMFSDWWCWCALGRVLEDKVSRATRDHASVVSGAAVVGVRWLEGIEEHLGEIHLSCGLFWFRSLSFSVFFHFLDPKIQKRFSPNSEPGCRGFCLWSKLENVPVYSWNIFWFRPISKTLVFP